MLDTVKVAPDSFRSMMFMASSAKREFTQDRRPNNEKPQKRTGDGVPLWSVQVATTDWRGRPMMLTVSIPSTSDPADDFGEGEVVKVDGLVFGVTSKREGGFVTWCSADRLESALSSKTVRAVS